MCHHEFYSVLIFKDSSGEIGGDIYKCDFLLLYNEMCQHLENMLI